MNLNEMKSKHQTLVEKVQIFEEWLAYEYISDRQREHTKEVLKSIILLSECELTFNNKIKEILEKGDVNQT